MTGKARLVVPLELPASFLIIGFGLWYLILPGNTGPTMIINLYD